MILGPGPSKHSCGGAHDGNRLFTKRVIAGWSGSPVDGVFHHSGNRIVVFRGDHQDSVGRFDFSFKFLDFVRKRVLQVLIKNRNSVELKYFQFDVLGNSRVARSKARL